MHVLVGRGFRLAVAKEELERLEQASVEARLETEEGGYFSGECIGGKWVISKF